MAQSVSCLPVSCLSQEPEDLSSTHKAHVKARTHLQSHARGVETGKSPELLKNRMNGS